MNNIQKANVIKRHISQWFRHIMYIMHKNKKYIEIKFVNNYIKNVVYLKGR